MRTNLPPERARDDLPPKAQRLRDIGRQALGEGWQYRLAQAENVGVKTVQRWASGERECPDHILAAVEKLLAEWRKSGLARLLRDVEGEAERSPAFAIVASAHLADLAQQIKPTSGVPKDRRYKPKSPEPKGS